MPQLSGNEPILGLNIDVVIGTFHDDAKSTSSTHTNPKSTASNI
jgi:hypothetical protein